ncbi:MAG: hypothetical protein GX032_04070 [Tenericutes bacterium]|nr:hypothetical protein [Mycoplasmatota bacterium]
MNRERFLEVKKELNDIYYKRKEVEQQPLEYLITEYTGLLFKGIFNTASTPNTKIVDSSEYLGCYDGYIGFEINRAEIQEFQKREALRLFETIAHELQHFRQKREYEKVNIRNSFMEKDNYLKEKFQSYYQDNYCVEMSEIDAFLSQHNDATFLLKDIGIVPSEKEINKSKIKTQEFSQNIGNPWRIVGVEMKNIFDLFNEEFEKGSLEMDEFDRTNFMEFRPCTNIEYKFENNRFVRRNSNELEKIYEDWKNGELQLKGDALEIDTYFSYIIEKTVEKDNAAIK